MKDWFLKIFKAVKENNVAKIVLISVVLLIAALLVFVCCHNKKEKEQYEHYSVAESYVDFFVKDNAVKQYELLDNSVIKPVDNFEELLPENYKREPLVEKYLDVTITKTEEAKKGVLKKINNVYKSYCPANGFDEEFLVEKAFKYNVKIDYKGKTIHNVNFWIVLRNEELKICTVYEYERSIDRCFAARLY